MKKQSKILEPYKLPDIFYAHGMKFQIQERGKRCYTLRSVDEHKFQYRVMARLVRTCPMGLTEVLLDNQEYERFKTMEQAEKHFHKVEKNGIDVMLPVKK